MNKNRICFCLGGGIGDIVSAISVIKTAVLNRFNVKIIVQSDFKGVGEILRLINGVEDVLEIPSKYSKDSTLKNNTILDFIQDSKQFCQSSYRGYIKHDSVVANDYWVGQSGRYKILLDKFIDSYEVVKIDRSPLINTNLTKKAKDGFVVIGLGAKPEYPGKKWNKYPKLASLIKSPIIVPCLKTDLDSRNNWWESKIVFESPNVKLHYDLKLIDVFKLINSANCYIGNDCGISHLAFAANVKCLTIWGPTNPYNYIPDRSSIKTIYLNMNCKPCDSRGFYRNLNCDMKCMKEIDETHVYNSYVELIKN